MDTVSPELVKSHGHIPQHLVAGISRKFYSETTKVQTD